MYNKTDGMGPSKLADTLQISLAEAEDLFNMYAKAFPKLNHWLNKAGADAVRNGYSTTFAPCKRRRWYPELKIAAQDPTSYEAKKIKAQVQRNGGNSPVQG